MFRKIVLAWFAWVRRLFGAPHEALLRPTRMEHIAMASHWDYCPLLENYPELRHAVAPEPLAEPPAEIDRDELYAAARAFWDEQLARGPTFRKRVGKAVGPIPSRGYCLEPLVANGAAHALDPSLPARHGDLVMLQERRVHRDEELALARADAAAGDADAKRWLDAYGKSRTLCCTKLLMAHRGRYYAVYSPEASPFFVVPLEAYNGILGVVIALHALLAASAITNRVDRLDTITPRRIGGGGARDGDDADPFNAGSVVPDPFFSRRVELWDPSDTANRSKYFWADRSAGTGSCEIEATGGVEGGRLLLHGSGVGNYPLATMVPREAARFVRGEYLRLNVRVRKATATTTATGTLNFSIGAGNEDGAIGWTSGSTQLAITPATINGWTVNTWYEFENVVQMSPSSSTTQYPRICLYLTHILDVDPGIEVDAATLVRIAAP